MKNKYINSGRVNQKLKTRNIILAAAQNFLSKKQTYSLEDLAQEANISRATIYRYFSNVDTLSAEAALDLLTKKPEILLDDFKNLNIIDFISETQNYFNKLAIDNEQLFRKYLSVVMLTNSTKKRRGARRVETLKMAFSKEGFKITQKELDKICHFSSLLMGIEALIVMKDVCNLNNQESIDTLHWGLDMFIKGILQEYQLGDKM